jgi:FKBP-type peptidyl-prolyl cis-trans isomerase
MIISDIRFTLLDGNTSSAFVAEFDNRDFTKQGAPHIDRQKEMDEYISNDFRCMVTEEGFGKSIPKGALVQLHYKAKLMDGSVFDSTYEKGQPT